MNDSPPLPFILLRNGLDYGFCTVTFSMVGMDYASGALEESDMGRASGSAAVSVDGMLRSPTG